MNVAFYLLPKSETHYLSKNCTVRQAVEIMEHHSVTALPILDNEGRYVGSISTADILWYLKNNCNLNLKEAEHIPLMQVPRKFDNKPVSINADIMELLNVSMAQNFMPVIDDLGVFIGIVRRREILCEYQKLTQKNIGLSISKNKE